MTRDASPPLAFRDTTRCARIDAAWLRAATVGAYLGVALLSACQWLSGEGRFGPMFWGALLGALFTWSV